MKLKNWRARQLACAILFLACACSSPTKDAPAEDKKEPEPAHETVVVQIVQMKFVPDTITVNKGDEVEFVNHDLVPHDVTEEATKAWSSSPLQPEQYWVMTATVSQNYYCSLHQVMKGKIIVK